MSSLNVHAQFIFVRCLTYALQYEMAFKILKNLLESNQVFYGAINHMLIISEKTSGAIQEEALCLYEECSALYEEVVDLEDIVNSRIVFDDVTKKETRALASLTPHDFKKEMFNTQPVASEDLCNLYMMVAKVYIEKEMYGMAERYLRKLLVSGYKLDEIYADLSAVYGKLGNKTLAAEMAKNAPPSALPLS